MNKYDETVELNKVNYSIRTSQALYQYGVGGLVDFREQTLMTASPDTWDTKDMVTIDDERLAKSLGVENFKMPGGYKNSTISYVRFPEWYFCPQCKRLMPLKEWVKEYKVNVNPNIYKDDKYMLKHMKCPKCKKQDLVVSRLVCVCDNGHISDFPWVEWAHAKNFGGAKDVCANPKIKFTTAGSSGGLGGMFVECTTCKAKATLRDSFDPKTFEDLDNKNNGKYNFKCKGKHPWKKVIEKCDCYPKAMFRGSTSVYYPYTVKSLLIPPYSDTINKRIVETEEYNRLINVIKDYKEDEDNSSEEVLDFIHKKIDSYSKKISEQLQEQSVDKIKSILERRLINKNQEIIMADSIKYKAEEYQALTGRIKVVGDKTNDFKREETNIKDYNIPFLKQISLIKKVKEVRAQIGFTRIKPTEKNEDGTKSSTIVDIKDKRLNWYPAYQVYGEGIFIEFEPKYIDEWIKNNPEIQKRADILNNHYKRSFGSNVNRNVTPRFILLHTLSHLLIKQLSFECGYNIASLCERLYCSETIDNMAGIFIYTSDGDSEGTLGGLVRQGRSDTFPSIFKKAIEGAIFCSNDPVCSLSNGQGRDSLNLAACYSCTLIPETSCEEFNSLLDRAMIVGTFDNRRIGLFYEYLFNNKVWESTELIYDNNEIVNVDNDNIDIKLYDGTEMNLSYEEIWTNLSTWLNDEKEKNNIEILKKDNRFNELEKPFQGCNFKNVDNTEEYSCDLVWKKSKVMLFTKENEDGYLIAKNSNYKCFYLQDGNIFEELINNLKRD